MELLEDRKRMVFPSPRAEQKPPGRRGAHPCCPGGSFPASHRR
jgi:hypothetical protein